MIIFHKLKKINHRSYLGIMMMIYIFFYLMGLREINGPYFFIIHLFSLYTIYINFRKKTIKTYSLLKCLDQIQLIKYLAIPVFIGGGINEQKAKEIISLLSPDGIDVSRSLKNNQNIISAKRLKHFLNEIAVV